jgi:hypothetical protein
MTADLPAQLVNAAAEALRSPARLPFERGGGFEDAARAAILGFLNALPKDSSISWPEADYEVIGSTSYEHMRVDDLADRIEQGDEEN